jgi:predicted DsbA family dithiol-disulfide isomerase
VEVEWKAFAIDPGTDPRGEAVEAYCRRRWGGSGWTQQLRREGRASGASFGDWRYWPSSLKAHQLVQYGKRFHSGGGGGAHHSSGISHRVKAVLFEALYESGQNPSTVEGLVEIARSGLGWDGAEAERLRRYLQHDEGLEAVRDEIREGGGGTGCRPCRTF